MRCDNCPLCPTYDEESCTESENEYGLEHDDGMWGCRHPRNWVDKRYEEYMKHFEDGYGW